MLPVTELVKELPLLGVSKINPVRRPYLYSEKRPASGGRIRGFPSPLACYSHMTSHDIPTNGVLNCRVLDPVSKETLGLYILVP